MTFKKKISSVCRTQNRLDFVHNTKADLIKEFFFQLIIFDVIKGPFIEEFHQCVTYSFYTAYWQEQLYTTFTLFFMFVVPLTILIGTYVATFRTISGNYISFEYPKINTS